MRAYTGICVDTIIALTIADKFRILAFMNHPYPTRHAKQSKREILYPFESTDCMSEVS